MAIAFNELVIWIKANGQYWESNDNSYQFKIKIINGKNAKAKAKLTNAKQEAKETHSVQYEYKK